MTFHDLLAFMRERNMEALQRSLESAIRAEAKELFAVRRQPGSRRARLLSEAQIDAERFYTDEIVEYLVAPDLGINPDDVLNHRRKPTAWAIARKIEVSCSTRERNALRKRLAP